MTPKNLLFIFSDEHTQEITGCYGNSIVRTPVLDALAVGGTRFDNAYTNCPICVPARASLATGSYVHQIGTWDNAHPYTDSPPGWGQRLIDKGHEVTAIGKLHYRDSQDTNGFGHEIDTLNVVDGLGDLLGLERRDMVERGAAKQLAAQSGPGDSTYIRYDASTAAHACRWLAEEAPKLGDRPWVLFVGFVLPHFPLIAPQEYYDLYPPDALPWPRFYGPDERQTHPVIETLSQVLAYDPYFDDRTVRVARSAYFGMVSLLDHNIDLVLDALKTNGHGESTRILYTSDHGDNLGHRGLWGKSVMYEEAAKIPGLALTEEEQHHMPGHSLYGMAAGETPERTVLSEYHAAGSSTGFFMIRDGKWKYVHYVGEVPQLFDLEADPQEARDLGTSADHGAVLARCEAKLRAIVDPEAVNARAFRDQQARIEANGGLEAIRARGDFGYTPAPGQVPIFD
jgi:choline-sulfatase